MFNYFFASFFLVNFLEQPQNQSTFLGETVVFRCIFNNSTDQAPFWKATNDAIFALNVNPEYGLNSSNPERVVATLTFNATEANNGVCYFLIFSRITGVSPQSEMGCLSLIGMK